jgi:dihydroorotase
VNDLLIRGGRIVDPSQSIDAKRDLRIRGGLIVEIGENLAPAPGEQVFEAEKMIVAPGFIDMHVHLREPGAPEKETIGTGTEAAVRGGFTAVACMPNTNPALDSADVLHDLKARIDAGARCRVHPIGAVTRGRKGVEPCDFPSLARAGAVAFSDDGSTVMNARVLREAAQAANRTFGVFISHCEDEHIKGNAVMHEGSVSRALGVPGSPALAEDVIVARDLLIGMETERPWHIAHLSTYGSLETIEYMRSKGSKATCEVTPHHLLLTDETVRERGAGGKVNPPLRTGHDARVLRDAVRAGTIDVFATDHAPHTAEDKSGDLSCAAVGFSGLEIAVGAYALALPELPLSTFVALLSTNPARILGVQGGTLTVGAVADVTIFADRRWTVDSGAFASKGRSTPFDGWAFERAPMGTIVEGRIVWQAKW